MATAKRPMPEWTKPSAALVALFEEVTVGLPNVEKRKMFGYPAAFVSGQMCCGLFQDRMMIRLPEADREEIVGKHGAKAFEPIPGRPMREYVEVPGKMLKNRKVLLDWLSRSVQYAGTLPAKIKIEKKPTGLKKK